MILELKKRFRIIKKSKKIKVFYFGSTVKKESNNFYITEIKENKKFIYFGAGPIGLITGWLLPEKTGTLKFLKKIL
jgi:hypothetical protein